MALRGAFSWICILYFFLSLIAKRGESYSWYSTIGELRNLTEREQVILRDVNNTLLLETITINLLQVQIETILQFLKEHAVIAKQNSSDDALMLQCNEWLNRQLLHLQRQIFPLNDTHIKSIGDEIGSFPDTDDLKVSQNVLLDLQELNNLEATDLAQGYIMGEFSGTIISSMSCYKLASIACTEIDKYDHKTCLEWRGVALSRTNGTSDASYLENEIAFQVKKRARMRWYSELCSASVKQTYIKNRSNPELSCFLWDNNHHPFLILQPVRAELLSSAPTIVMFYNVISDKKIDYILKNATSMLGKATTMINEQTIHFDGNRVAHNCWFDTEEHTVTQILNRYAEAITRLSIDDSSELLQVANYGVGGQYKPHYDAVIPRGGSSESVFRRATFMYYLSDVQYGGATVFLHPGIAVRPVKGAAIFWHNLMWDSGSLDKRTSHGSCPVLSGNKWIANQWIWESWSTACLEHRYDVKLDR